MSCRNMASSKITLRFEPKFPGPTPFSYPSSAAMRGTCAYPSLGSLLIFLFFLAGVLGKNSKFPTKGKFQLQSTQCFAQRNPPLEQSLLAG